MENKIELIEMSKEFISNLDQQYNTEPFKVKKSFQISIKNETGGTELHDYLKRYFNYDSIMYLENKEHQLEKYLDKSDCIRTLSLRNRLKGLRFKKIKEGIQIWEDYKHQFACYKVNKDGSYTEERIIFNWIGQLALLTK